MLEIPLSCSNHMVAEYIYTYMTNVARSQPAIRGLSVWIDGAVDLCSSVYAVSGVRVEPALFQLAEDLPMDVNSFDSVPTCVTSAAVETDSLLVDI